MSTSALQIWIKNNLKPIPAIPLYAKQAQKIITKKDFEKLELSKIIASDPGLSSQLFNLVNAKRKGTKLQYIESILSALSLMGDPGIIKFIKNISTLDDISTSIDCNNDYLGLIARAQQAAKHAKLWGVKRHSQGIKEIGCATRLYDIAEFSFCLFDHQKYKLYQKKNQIQYDPDKHCNELLNFDLHQLSLTLCEHFHLPVLVHEAHSRTETAGIRSQGIQISSELMHQADINWYSKETFELLKKAADLCQMPYGKMNTMVHLTSVESARELDFKVNFHSASKLVQHKAPPRPQALKETQPKTPSQRKIPATEIKPTKKTKPTLKSNLLSDLKETAQNKKTSQAVQLNSLLEGFQKYLKFNRNILFLLNQDRSRLSTRLHKGLENNSALIKFSIPKQESGLLKILLEKPQAIWINPDNFSKYEKILPRLFKSCSLSDDFFMMSLFSNNRPVGIVFCDNNENKIGLNKEQFSLFKQAVGLTSKAMMLISQRQKKVVTAKA